MAEDRGAFVSTLAGVLSPGSRLRASAVGCLGLAAAVLVGLLVVVLEPAVAAVLVVAGIALAVLIRDPTHALWCALAVMLLLPFGTLPVDIGLTPTLLEMALIGTVAVTVLRQASLGRRELIITPVGAPLLLFLGLMVASFVMGVGHARPSATSLRRFMDLVLSVAFFYVAVNVIEGERAVRRTYYLILGLGAAAAMLGVVLYAVPQSLAERVLVALGRLGYPTSGVLRYIEDNPDLPMRAVGTSVDPNVFGGMLAFLGGLTVPQVFAAGSRRWRVVALGVLGLVLLALLLTFSRGSMFGLAAAIGVLGVLRQRKLVWLLLMGALLVLVLPPTRGYVQHFVEGIRGQDLATQMRFGEYKDALILITRYPWFGVGFTGVPDVDIYLGVSSVYLLIAEEMGLVGLCAFVASLLVFFAYLWPRTELARQWSPSLEAVMLGCQTAVLAAMVAGVLDHYLFNLAFPHVATFLWTIVALGVSAARSAETSLDGGA